MASRTHLTMLLLAAALFQHSCSDRHVTPDNALEHYLSNRDHVFSWEVRDTLKTEGLTLYRIIFTSQKWRETIWKHELTVMIPDRVDYRDALLFISGGSLKDGEPKVHKWTDGLIAGVGKVAAENRAVTAVLWQVPNQPLYDDLTEDALISYTFHNYQNDKDITWPLLFPMVKSAVRAMDVITEFTENQLEERISGFVVTGASKRGWTTWLTGAHDSRVKAIAPMVIDVLNMPVNVDYQKKVWGDYSIEIQDYVNLGIASQVSTPEGADLVRMVDPYSYRQSLSMPKMLFMGTNDPYWPVDAVKNYIDSVPGINLICYTPNAGHDLAEGVKAFPSLSAFFGMTLDGGNYPVCDYSVSERGGLVSLSVKTSEATPDKVVLWYSVSADQDFRNEVWRDSVIIQPASSSAEVVVRKPSSGYKAFFIDLHFKSPSGTDYTHGTRMFVADSLRLLLQD